MGSFGARAFFMNSGGRPEVASVQYGSISLPAGTTSATATITSVDTTRSVVMSLGVKTNAPDTNGTAWAEGESKVTLTNATTVTASGGGNTYTSTHYFVVIQFNSGSIKSLQDVIISGSDTTTSDTATITSVNASKALVIPRDGLLGRGGTANNGSGLSILAYGTQLTNATTLTHFRQSQAGSGRGDTNVTVVEFN